MRQTNKQTDILLHYYRGNKMVLYLGWNKKTSASCVWGKEKTAVEKIRNSCLVTSYPLQLFPPNLQPTISWFWYHKTSVDYKIIFLSFKHALDVAYDLFIITHSQIHKLVHVISKSKKKFYSKKSCSKIHIRFFCNWNFLLLLQT